MLSTISIFDYNGGGLGTFLRALHVLAGICWIGLLYYFNVVQVPAFAAYGDERRARNVSIDKLARRALWWFRWAAITTFVLGILIMGLTKDYMKDFMTNTSTIGLGHSAAILVGMAAGTLMMLNVWGIIWRNQKVVLANAAGVLGGAEANPAAPVAGRAALLASRANFIFSFSMLWFMIGAAHLYGGFDVNSAGKAWTFVIIAVAIGGIIELLALGLIGGKAATNKLLWPFESHKNALISGVILWAVLYVLSEILLKTSAFG
jgi:hypothetical protein